MSETSADKVAELAVKAAGVPDILSIDNNDKREFILHPPGWVAKEVPQLPQNIAPPIPQWTNQIVRLQNEHSLVDYINRFKNQNTMIFADITKDTITAIIDYHHHTIDTESAVKPELKSHRAILSLPRSIEWGVWNDHNEDEMSQLEFVNFLEDNAVDVRAFAEGQPDGAAFLELCRDLQGTRNVKFGGSVRSGSMDNIEFTKESGVQTRGTISLPQSIGLQIPVYFGDDLVQLTALIRRHISSDGALTLWYKLLRPENVRQTRFQQIVDRIHGDVDGLTTVYGTAD